MYTQRERQVNNFLCDILGHWWCQSTAWDSEKGYLLYKYPASFLYDAHTGYYSLKSTSDSHRSIIFDSSFKVGLCNTFVGIQFENTDYALLLDKIGDEGLLAISYDLLHHFVVYKENKKSIYLKVFDYSAPNENAIEYSYAAWLTPRSLHHRYLPKPESG